MDASGVAALDSSRLQQPLTPPLSSIASPITPGSAAISASPCLDAAPPPPRLPEPGRTCTLNGAGFSSEYAPARPVGLVGAATGTPAAAPSASRLGCDRCGESPITGRCFKCLDCPDAVGYDLCDECHALPVGADEGPGRFGQHHTPDHRMEERPQEITPLHELLRAHPELSMQEIFAFVAMQVQELDGALADDDAAGFDDEADGS